MKSEENAEQRKKKKNFDRVLVLVAAPPASGKSYIGKKIAGQFRDCAYMDLDSLNVLSEKICDVRGEDFDKSGSFFRENGREYEYEALFTLAWDVLSFCHVAVLTAPFSREMKDPKRFEAIVERAGRCGAKVIPVWILSDEAVCRKNMFRRNAPRDQWKREHFPDYIMEIDFTRPTLIPEKYQVDNRGKETWKEDVRRIAGLIRDITEGQQEE